MLIPDRNGHMHDPKEVADFLDSRGDQLNVAIGEAMHDAADVVRALASQLAEAQAKHRDTVEADVAALMDENEKLKTALQKISDIRDSIIGGQLFNWSEHAYPLVAALDEVGYPGVGYEIARKNLGTLIEQIKAAEAALEAERADHDRVMTLAEAAVAVVDVVRKRDHCMYGGKDRPHGALSECIGCQINDAVAAFDKLNTLPPMGPGNLIGLPVAHHRCPVCKKLTRDSTAGCDHCDLEDQ